MSRGNKTQGRYVPRSLPPQPQIISWGSNSKPAIIKLFEAGKDAEEISNLTRNRISFVKSVIYRHQNPQEFVFEPQPSGKVSRSCLGCGKLFDIYASKGQKYCNRACRYAQASVIIACNACKKEMKIRKSELSKGRKYCSIECYGLNRPKRVALESVMVSCKVCGVTFRAWPSQLARGRKHCSQRCYGITRRKPVSAAQ